MQKEAEATKKQTLKELNYFKEGFERLRAVQEQQNANVNSALSMINEKMPMLHQLVPVLAIPVAPARSEEEKASDAGCRQSEVLQKTIRGMLVALEWLAIKTSAGSS